MYGSSSQYFSLWFKKQIILESPSEWEESKAGEELDKLRSDDLDNITLNDSSFDGKLWSCDGGREAQHAAIIGSKVWFNWRRLFEMNSV